MSKIYEEYKEYLEGSQKMQKIGEVYLLGLLPENLRNDPDIIAASIGVDKEFWALVDSINNYLTITCLTIDDIDEIYKIDGEFPGFLDKFSNYLDNLAGEMNVDFYDQNFDLENRLALVKNGYNYKYRKGTADAVKQIVTDAFKKTTVQEWFDYDGEPYHFKISTETNLPDESKIINVVRAVNSVKNARSTLDCVEALKSSSLNTYYGFGVQQTCRHKVIMGSIWNDVDAANISWDDLDNLGSTWNQLEVYRFE